MSNDPTTDEIIQTLNLEALRETVKSLEQTKLNLLITIKDLKEKLAQQKDDQADIYFFLNKKCDESFEIIASLEEQLLNEQADREIAEKMYETKIEEMRGNFLNSEGKYQAKIADLEGTLQKLNEFSYAKDDMEKNLREITSKLDEERAYFTSTTETLENKYLLERERLRKAYDAKYEELKKELESSIDGKLSKKTQRTQIMNVIMKKELDTQSRHAERLLEINEQVIEREKKMKVELDISLSLQEELSKKLNKVNRENQKLKDNLEEKLRETEDLKKKHETDLEEKTKENLQVNVKASQIAEKLKRQSDETDELWLFLKKSFQRLKKSYGSTIKEEENMTHEDILVSIIKDLMLRYPNELSHFLRAGKEIEVKTSVTSKSGIHSWDIDLSTGVTSSIDIGTAPKHSMPVMTTEKSVQTEFSTIAKSLDENSSLWAGHSMIDGSSTAGKRIFGDSSVVSEMDTHSISAYSVPTLLGRHPHVDKNNFNPISSYHDSNDASSAIIPGFTKSKGYSHKNRQYHQRNNWELPTKKHLQMSNSNSQSFDEKGDLLFKDPRTESPLRVKRRQLISNSTSSTLSKEVDVLLDMSVMGRKFVAPLTLPRLT